LNSATQEKYIYYRRLMNLDLQMENLSALGIARHNNLPMRVKVDFDEHIFDVDVKPFNRDEVRKINCALVRRGWIKNGYGDINYGKKKG